LLPGDYRAKRAGNIQEKSLITGREENLGASIRSESFYTTIKGGRDSMMPILLQIGGSLS